MDRISGIWTESGRGRLEGSIVVPAYNEAACIQETIVALAKSVFGTGCKVELIVVNNASTDDTAGLAARLGAVVVDEGQKGLSYARQAGVVRASGPVILSTDADTRVGPRWTQGHLRHYGRRDIAGVVGTNDFEGAHWLYRIHRAGASVVHAAAHLVGRGPKGHWSGCNMSYRTDAVREVGGYEPGSDFGEDRMISQKLEQVGLMILDTSEDLRVVTSGRRFDTAAKVGSHIIEKIGMLASGKLYGRRQNGRTFTDIR